MNKMTNKQLQIIVDESDDYCPIAKNELQFEVTSETEYIIDVSADEQGRHHKDGEMMCIYDRDGKNYYPVKIKKWW